jgi:S-formylglutathione hydrolase FrmB
MADADNALDAAYWAALASGDEEKAWAHFDPCGLLAKLVEAGK